MEGSKILTIRPNEFNFDRDGYDHTKVLGLKCYCGDNQLKIISNQPTTWASLAREVVNSFSYEIEQLVEYNWKEFEMKFNLALQNMINVWGGRTNINFVEELFKEPTHLRSSVYINNQNSKLKIFDIPDSTEARYITAVYSGEVVWVLNALVTSLEQYGAFIEIEYIKRDDLRKQLDSIDEEERQLSIKDLEYSIDADNPTDEMTPYQVGTVLDRVERSLDRVKLLQSDVRYDIKNILSDIKVDLKQFFKEMNIDYTKWDKKFHVFEDIDELKNMLIVLEDDLDMIEIYLKSCENDI